MKIRHTVRPVKRASCKENIAELLFYLNQNFMCVKDPPPHIDWADRLYQYEKLLLAEHLINKVLSLSPYTNAERRFLISQNYSDLMRWYFDLWCYIYGPPVVKS